MRSFITTRFVLTGYMEHVREHGCKKPRSMTCCGKGEIVFNPKLPSKIFSLLAYIPTFMALPLEAQLVNFISLFLVLAKP